MIELATATQRHLDEYLGELRASLAGCPSVSIEDVERDVMEHIEKSLAETPTPVDLPALSEVLDMLGSPSQWIPEEERSWLRQCRLAVRQVLLSGVRRIRLAVRRVLLRLRSGPEDFRLAYLSIVALALVLPLLEAEPEPLWSVACFALSFILARASLAAAESPQALGAQRWLIYPVLILVYAPLAAGLLFLTLWAGGVAVLAGLVCADPAYNEQYTVLGTQAGYPLWMIISYSSAFCTAVWWTLLGAISCRWPALVQNTFYPMASGYRRRHGFFLGIIGLLILVVTLVFGASVLS